MDEVRPIDLLLIEDNPDDVLLLQLLLSERPEDHFVVRHAGTLGQALEVASQTEPAVALVDLGLPDANGLDVVAGLRAALPHLPLVILTGSGDEALGRAAVRTGAQDFLVKGQVDAATLSRALLHACERQRLVRELEEARTQANHRATHDALTGLPNRTLFFDRLSHLVARAGREVERFAVAYLDLDEFKPINDTFGHATGDQVLIQTGIRLHEGLRRSDTVARLGGDEFGVLLERVADRPMAESVVETLRRAVGQPIEIEERVVRIGFSAGIALFPEDGQDAQTLMDAADAAMYRLKRETTIGGDRRRLAVSGEWRPA